MMEGSVKQHSERVNRRPASNLMCNERELEENILNEGKGPVLYLS